MSGRSEKYAWEKWLINGDFSNRLGMEETITDYEVTATDSAGADATAEIIVDGSTAVSGRKLFALWQAGEVALSPYIVEFRATSSAGEQHIIRASLRVKE